jgi:3-methyladenine DNA glycosylase AlkD
MKDILLQIQQHLKQKSSPEAIAAYKKFVPGNIKIYGVRTPVIDELAKQYKSGGFMLIEELWKAGALEEKIMAVKILQKTAKTNAVKSLQLINNFADGIDNWAVCDALGMQALQSIKKTHAAEIFALAKKYNHSSNFWQRRLSLVLVEWYTRDKTYHPAINKLITPLEKEEEYYVKKAVAWIKRNLAKGK